MKKWGKTRHLKDLRKRAAYFGVRRLSFKSKVKLNGTNMAVHITEDGHVIPQSRKQLLVDGVDAYDFAKWVATQTWDGLRRNIVIYGEWIGPGIQSGTACNQIPERIWAIFGILDLNEDRLVTDPSEIEDYFQLTIRGSIKVKRTSHKIYVIPWHDFEVFIDWSGNNDMALQAIDAEVKRVCACDPFIKEHFGIEGPGEGLVFYPQEIQFEPYHKEFLWKAKGEKHRVHKAKKAAQIAPERIQKVQTFVDTFVTEKRLEQAVTEACEGSYDSACIGSFLKWLSGDIQKEADQEIELMRIPWKVLVKAINTTAVKWFKWKQSDV